jgi:NhaP-type Na+/H+ or K+/H+ antiporter
MPFSVQDFLTLTIISTIMFSLFVKVPTVPLLIKKLKLNKLNRLEELELELARIIIFLEDIEKLKESYNK